MPVAAVTPSMSPHHVVPFAPNGSRLSAVGETVGSPTASATQALTPAEKLDADHVIVAFLENDTGQPVILPLTAGHPAAAAIKASGGRVRRIRHHGTAIDWDASGNLTLDARGAAAEEPDPLAGLSELKLGRYGESLRKLLRPKA